MGLADGASMTTALHDRLVHVEPVMGTVVSLDVRGTPAPVADAAFARLMAWLHDVDGRFSTYRDDSEVCRIDRGELPVALAGEDVRWVLERCARLRRQTAGAFDERAGGRLDPSAFVKGWAVERGADLLRAEGLTDFSLNAGGDVIVRGGALPERAWRVGIQHPHDRLAIAAAIEVTALAVATPRGDGGPGSGRPPPRPLRARRAPGRPAHRRARRRRPVGHRRRPRPRAGRRLLDRRVRDGRRRAAMDAGARRLRGDDDPRRRPGAVHAGLPAAGGVVVVSAQPFQEPPMTARRRTAAPPAEPRGARRRRVPARGRRVVVDGLAIV